MGVRATAWFLMVLLSVALAACGGSGSSGFDAFPNPPASENAAITQALQEHNCVKSGALEVCPATQEQFNGSTTPTASPTPPAAATPTVVSRPTTTATPAPAGTPFPATPTPTATPTPEGPPGISIDLNPFTPISCIRLDAGCAFTVAVAPHGFPAGTVYRIATRTLEPPGPWMIGPPFSAPVVSASPVDAPGSVTAAAPMTDAGTAIQLAVLVFLDSHAVLASEVEQLADTGARYAFVTEQLVVLEE